MSKRNIIRIDEEKCTGCGECVTACAEGALAIVDGKARLVSDVYCDGLGACIGECPEGALEVVEREAEDFDEAAVEERLKKTEAEARECSVPSPAGPDEPLACGCPSSASMSLKPRGAGKASKEAAGEIASELSHWPIKLQLIRPDSPFLKGSDLILLADCGAAAYPDLHRKLLKGRAVCMGCPKFDDIEGHIEKLAAILETARPKSLTVVIMEVPCCRGLVFAAEKAVEAAGSDVPLHLMVVARDGETLVDEKLSPKAA